MFLAVPYLIIPTGGYSKFPAYAVCLYRANNYIFFVLIESVSTNVECEGYECYFLSNLIKL